LISDSLIFFWLGVIIVDIYAIYILLDWLMITGAWLMLILLGRLLFFLEFCTLEDEFIVG
jgi:hypothetical protein